MVVLESDENWVVVELFKYCNLCWDGHLLLVSGLKRVARCSLAASWEWIFFNFDRFSHLTTALLDDQQHQKRCRHKLPHFPAGWGLVDDESPTEVSFDANRSWSMLVCNFAHNYNVFGISCQDILFLLNHMENRQAYEKWISQTLLAIHSHTARHIS